MARHPGRAERHPGIQRPQRAAPYPTWLRGADRARSGGEDTLPQTSAQGDGPPPAARWAERDPAAARRLEGARTVVAAIADEHNVPSENLLLPDTVRRLSWSPPAVLSAESIRGELASYGARPWQTELTALPLAGRSAACTTRVRLERAPTCRVS